MSSDTSQKIVEETNILKNNSEELPKELELSEEIVQKDSQEITMNNENNQSTTIQLQLGDVIHVNSPSNNILNNQSFIINYIDTEEIKLINTETLNSFTLKIKDGTLGDGSITNIDLLYRDVNLGYARQNNLLPGTWINIYFGGDIPIIITGEISNLEEDMIEIKTYPDNDILYINFGYKGIPENLEIKNIEIRDKPDKKLTSENFELENLELQGEDEEEREEGKDLEEGEIEEDDIQEFGIPSVDLKDQLKEFIIKANDIQFGKTLGSIVQFVDVEESQQRYNISSQTTDLLDEMLSTIPNIQRTPQVLNNIHIMIERFKQLRMEFSEFDENKNVVSALIKDSTWKPLVNDLLNFNTNLYWILPVAKNVKKLYDVVAIEGMSYPNIDILSENNDLLEMTNIIKNYKSSDAPDEVNKYITLMRELNPYLTPFEDINPESKNDIIYEVPISNNVNAIIDNLGDFYSYIAEKSDIKSKRFLTQTYNLGLNTLEVTQMTQSKMITRLTNLTNSDTLSLKSIMTLPESTIQFSHVNLPGTNILIKANLNQTFLNYWQLLKNSTIINNIIVDDLQKELEFNEETFANDIKNFSLNQTDKMSQEKYRKFLNTMIPKTKVLFNLIKKYIKGKLSLVDVVSYLEPFLIYTDDLTYQQYNEINKFVIEKISEYNKNFIERSKTFTLFKRLSTYSNNPSSTKLIQLLENITYKSEVINSYREQTSIPNTNSEFLKKINQIDFGSLYNDAVSLENTYLMLSENIGAFMEKEEKDVSNIREQASKANKCKKNNIAKRYESLEEIEKDNNKIIYFDKKFDDTNYSILDDFEKDQIKMKPDDFKEFLIKKLISKYNYSQEDAPYITETLLSGIKRVLPGDIAIMYVSSGNEEKIRYFKRDNNKWKSIDSFQNENENENESDNDSVGYPEEIEGDKSIKLIRSGNENTKNEKEKETTNENEIFANDNSLLCNFQKECIEVDQKYKKSCDSYELNKATLTQFALKDIMNAFDKKYYISKKILEENIKKKYNYHLSVIEKLIEIEKSHFYKYNLQKFNIGIKNEENESEIIVSPYANLMNIICGQSDFVKKQNDIVRFAIKFTREAINNPNSLVPEDEHWRYCIQTNTKLLPLFMYTLASCFINEPENYTRKVDLIIKEIGAASDDNNSWVDKYSGYVIKNADFDNEEGYEDGFKKISRDILEQDLGDAILNPEIKPKIETKETKIISNIITALSTFMGINVEEQREFMIKLVNTYLPVALPSEKAHQLKIEEMAKSGKKIDSYKDIYNLTILYLTLGAYLIGLQLSIPSIKTRKTYPGCVRSFDGYPIEGTGDFSGLEYLSCVAYHIRAKTDPWNVLSRTKQDTIGKKIKIFIDTYFLSNVDVVRKMREKNEYLLLNPNELIPEEHELKKWTNFLPPLVPIKITHLENISNEFKSSLLQDLKKGLSSQQDKLLVIESKIIFFSLAIQEKIQNVVNKQHLLLANSANRPFLENACCNETGEKSTIQYFEKKEKDIVLYNNIVSELTNILFDIHAITNAPLFLSKENTKNIFPPLSNQFNEETIYMAYIAYCKFNSVIPLNEDLLSICSDKPDFLKKSDTISEKIKKLKGDGRNYTSESLLRLLQIVNRNNMINISFNKPSVTPIQRIRDILKTISLKNENKVVPPKLIENMDIMLDTYDLAVKEDTVEMRNMKNDLSKSNTILRNEIYSFIEENGDLTVNNKKNIANILKTFMVWESDKNTKTISENTTYNSIQLVKEFMQNIIKTFPNIILNKVDYNSIKIPKYWKLSNFHEGDIQKIVNNYYSGLHGFYNSPYIQRILTNIQLRCSNLLLLAKNTPLFSEITYKENKIHSVFDKRTNILLFENYILLSLKEYIHLANDKNMIVLEKDTQKEYDNIYTVESLEENLQEFEPTIRTDDVVKGDIKNLKKNTTKLLVAYLQMFNAHKNILDINYDKIMDTVFKTKEAEKDTITDRLHELLDEGLEVDTVMKINKLGVWGKGLRKGMTTYVKDTYDEERNEMENFQKLENKIRKNTNVDDSNFEQYMDDEVEENRISDEIDREENNMSYLTEDYMDGDFQGDEENNWDDYN